MKKPILFAKQELTRILSQMTDVDFSGLQVGLFSEFSQICAKTEHPTEYDDEIYIEVKDFCGVIAGLNPRSVLIAAYRYVSELGAKFITVGKEGEVLPKLTETRHVVSVQEAPSYRHRGICIEGAVSVENVIEMVDFLPKVGMNTYFIQFREAHTFFERWYGHTRNPLKENTTIPIEQSREYVREIVAAMRERGILYQAVGHGWTCEPFGVPGLGWDQWTEEIAPEVLENFAMVNGVRGLAKGIPLNTHACYSNPKVRKAIIDDVCRYVSEHPAVDVLHFWLADDANGVCECENCKKMLPSDMYVTLLNDLDAALTAMGSNAKIVFLLYLDLLWPPIEQKLNHPERFIMMFAPINRSYSTGFCDGNNLPPMETFVYNNIPLAKTPELNVSYLRGWQKVFHGDSFDYDYHYMWAFVHEPGTIKMANILWQDIRNLKNLDLNGFVSCQCGRVMFPTAFNLYVMGKTLWDRNVTFDTLKDEYFRACYGEQGSAVFAYLSELSERFAPLDLESKNLEQNPDKAKIIAEIRAFVQKKQVAPDARLAMYSEYCILLCDVLEAFYLGDLAAAKLRAELFRQFLWKWEDTFQSTYDAWSYDNVYEYIWEKAGITKK